MKKYVKQTSVDFLISLKNRTSDSFFLEWDNNSLEFEGSPNEFHNFSAELARNGYYGKACAVLEYGIETYPMNTDLLADFLNYGIKCNQLEMCHRIFNELDEIDDKRKTWRAFDFSIDYLLFLIEKTNNEEEIQKFKEHALNIIYRFKQSMPNNELPYLAEYQVYESTFEKRLGLKKLEEFLNDNNRQAKVAPKCHLKYIEEMLSMGQYEQVVLYANDGAAEAAEEQEGVDTGYFFYALALAMDALWLKADKGKTNVDKDEAHKILKYYQTAYDTLDDDKHQFFKVISKRYKIIANVAEISSQLNEWRNEQLLSNLQQMISDLKQ